MFAEVIDKTCVSGCFRSGEEEGEVIHMGNAIMSFYSALIDLLGRCAPEMHVSLSLQNSTLCSEEIPLLNCALFHLQLINAGKGEALRIRAILRSLVPTSDLVGIISIPLNMPVINKGAHVRLLQDIKLSE